jgi:adenosylcobinamide-GDP ribazoletransferase
MGPVTTSLRGFQEAVSFLTRIPVSARDERPERGVVWFPVVGALVGAVIGGVYVSASAVLEPFIAATLAIGVGALLTGGFHEDGLADTADAFGGGWNRDDVLRILKDPRQGTFGVLALVIVSLLKIGATATLDPWAGLTVLPAAHALSRSAAVGLFAFVSPAIGEGLGASYASQVTRARIIQTVLIGVVIALPLLGVLLVPAAAIALISLIVLARWTVKKAGGLTGDVLGAAQQVVETTALLVASAVVTNGWADLPWWRA